MHTHFSYSFSHSFTQNAYQTWNIPLSFRQSSSIIYYNALWFALLTSRHTHTHTLTRTHMALIFCCVAFNFRLTVVQGSWCFCWPIDACLFVFPINNGLLPLLHNEFTRNSVLFYYSCLLLLLLRTRKELVIVWMAIV